MSGRPPRFVAAAVQDSPIFLDRGATVEKACRLIEEAADHGARLIVFPEAFIPTYPFWVSRMALFEYEPAKRAHARLLKNAVEVPSQITEVLGRAVRKSKAYVVMGINEREKRGTTLYNSLVYFSPDGEILGTHRKLVPTHHERMVWGRGDGSTLGVFDTPLGRIGGLICWENYMPLARYLLYDRGVQIYIASTADDRDTWELALRYIAYEGRMFVIGTCMVFQGKDVPAGLDLPEVEELIRKDDWLKRGGSCLIAPDGSYLAGPVFQQRTILYATLDLEHVLQERQLFDVAGHYARPDILRLQFDPTPQRGVQDVPP